MFSNSISFSLFFLLSKLFFFSLFSLLFLLILNKKIRFIDAFDSDLNFLIFEIELKLSIFFLFLKGLIIIFENTFIDEFKFIVKVIIDSIFMFGVFESYES